MGNLTFHQQKGEVIHSDLFLHRILLSMDEHIDKMWPIHAMEYYSAVTRSEVLTLLRERRQTQEATYYVIPFKCNI